ncbi:Tm-1-like ATP-binding domain-containing protein [Hoeflea poritis]|uniref:Tm-1-like ATP-binding domain-containing protein n=1 Tax=Hoeflea poritis TaxID=2993659 RepID=A0ABT4VUD6_9HYPH|nr:Tm-1-like ATP-binding domain-containing protein [Hoeflea poritis]MDA4848327.1 Tm-1-like ATP-binding domain-containing protein [Hoeflea poritis]
MSDKTILVIGTYDTKDDELNYVASRIKAQGGKVLTMDVSVLGDPATPTDYSKHAVAEAGGSSIRAAIDSGDENTAMQIMAEGCAALCLKLWHDRMFDGVIMLGGSMGTDLALDVTAALPVGVPKYIVSTVSFSPMLPPERLAPDVQMILWAGGLYGLNAICKSSLSQAAGAVLGAARAVETLPRERPLVGMTSLGSSALRYMLRLKPALEERGFDLAVFHATGMGGRAFEGLAAQGAFVCVMDFCTQEVGNHIHGSNISAGPDRLTSAGREGVPQIVSAGCYDLVDIVAWQGVPDKWSGHPNHTHNRLINSIVLNDEERRAVARAHCERLAGAQGPTAFLMPNRGFGEWDREGADLHDPAGLGSFLDEMRSHVPANVDFRELDCHINDDGFADEALQIFDRWREEGVISV